MIRKITTYLIDGSKIDLDPIDLTSQQINGLVETVGNNSGYLDAFKDEQHIVIPTTSILVMTYTDGK